MTPNARLLVVDDEPSVLKLVKAILTRHNYDVETCESGKDALALLQKDNFDCVVTDAIMPVLSGYDLVKEIRKNSEFGQIPVVMLTRKRHRQDVKMAVEAGVSDYVLKPIDEHLLLEKVELCLKKGSAKKGLYESVVDGPQSEAEFRLPCRITSISESDVTIRLPFQIHEGQPTVFQSQLFEEIGIEKPMMKLVYCKPGADVPALRGNPFEAKYSFVGMQEKDLKRIRAWLQREELRRRK